VIVNLAPEQARIDLPPWARWFGFFAMCVGMFMAILDIQVVVTALQVVEKALGIGADQMSWVQTSYLIAEVIAIPLTGLLMRVFTMRWLSVVALTVFTLASVGCAYSHGFADLLAFRLLQGFSGGVLIPMVFSAIFLLFPVGFEQTAATTMGGFLAVLAPTLGPLIGGWLTENYSWHWLFLINVVPGILGVLVGYVTLPRGALRLHELKGLDWFSLLLLAVGLAALLLGLKDAPSLGWFSLPVLFWFGLSLVCALAMWRRPNPAVMFHLLKDRSLGFGCVLSFMAGFVLYGSVYLVPVFMAFVRSHTPLEIGKCTLVIGIAQLLAAAPSVQIDRFFNARWLAMIGFSVFGVGLIMNAGLDVSSDYDAHYWPQVVRGLGVTLCLLPPIRFALALIPLDKIGDASGLFNVARNIGGAIGIAMIDTLMFSRRPVYVDQISELIKTDVAKAAKVLGIAVGDMPALDDAMGMISIQESVQQAGLTMAINDCWLLMGGVCLAALPVILLLGPVRSALPAHKINQK
jgi:MFS transporter, DHA2 family, multidrug resistance protein